VVFSAFSIPFLGSQAKHSQMSLNILKDADRGAQASERAGKGGREKEGK
jgi:hypothetical protein